MATFEQVSQSLARLAEDRRPHLRRVGRLTTLAYRDGCDEAVLDGTDGGAWDAELARFMAVDAARTRVLGGLRRFLHDGGYFLEASPGGIWRCGTRDTWRYLHVGHRLSAALATTPEAAVLSDLIACVRDTPVFAGAVAGYLTAQRPVPEVRPFPADDARRVEASAPCLARRKPASRFDLPEVPAQDGPRWDGEAAAITEGFKAEVAAGRPKRFPHWSQVWRRQYEDPYWFRVGLDQWSASAWWATAAMHERALERNADYLSAAELLMSLDGDRYAEIGCKELAFWSAMGDPDVCVPLASFLLKRSPEAEALLDREVVPRPAQERALVRARHFPTMRRLALEFAAAFAQVPDSAHLDQTGLLEAAGVRRMGPVWAAALMGEAVPAALQERCAADAAELDAPRLSRICPHLVAWAADFFWPDVLSQLRANPAFPGCLAGLGGEDTVRLLLAWTLVRPDPFVRRLAVKCMQDKQPLYRLAGAVAWQRCRFAAAARTHESPEGSR